MRVAKPCLRISSMRDLGRAGIPTLTMSSFMTGRTTNCTKGRSSPGARSVYTSRAPFTSSCPTAMHDGRDLWLKVIKERSEKQELEGVYLGKEAGDLTPAGAFG